MDPRASVDGSYPRTVRPIVCHYTNCAIPVHHGLYVWQHRPSSSSAALQPGVGLGFLYNMPPSLSIPCSVSPSVYSHLSQVRGHVIQSSHFWSSFLWQHRPGTSYLIFTYVENAISIAASVSSFKTADLCQSCMHSEAVNFSVC